MEVRSEEKQHDTIESMSGRRVDRLPSEKGTRQVELSTR